MKAILHLISSIGDVYSYNFLCWTAINVCRKKSVSQNFFLAAALGAELVSLDKLLSESDFVFIIVPLRPETKHMFNMNQFKKMKPTSILINTSRGGNVYPFQLTYNFFTTQSSRCAKNKK